MADDRSGTQRDDQDQSSGKRVVGRGMTSPDSTEAVLYASTGEPDPRARGTDDASPESLGTGHEDEDSGGTKSR